MAAERTAEQVAADQQLEDATKAVCEAYGDGDPWVPMEYVLVYSMQRWDDEGDALTAVGTAIDSGSVPIHRLLGLVEYAAVRYRGLIAEGEWE
jgi:hypothetical protein